MTVILYLFFFLSVPLFVCSLVDFSVIIIVTFPFTYLTRPEARDGNIPT